MSFSVFVITNNISNRLDASYYSPDDINKEQQIKQLPYDVLGNKIKNMSSGATPKGATYLDKGVSFIRTQNVRDNLIEDEGIVFISEEDNATLKRSQLKEGDVLLTITGVDLGHSAVVQKKLLPANINQHSVKMETKDINSYFLSVFLNSKYGQSQIWRRVYGATRPAINYDEIKDIIVPLPSINVQQYIGNKIIKAEQLREEARELKNQVEHTFQSIFTVTFNNNLNKYWNVPINFLEDRLDANYYNQSFLTVREFLESLKNRGYLVTKLEEVVKDVYGGYPFLSTEFKETGVPLLRIRDIGEDVINFEVEAYIEKDKYKDFDKYLASPNTIVVGMDGNFIAGSFSKSMPDIFINQRIGIIKTKDYLLANYLKYYINSAIGQEQLNRGSVKTTVGHISLRDIEELLICIPSKDIVEEIGSKIYLATEKMISAKTLIIEARQDIESLIEGTFDKSKIEGGSYD